MDVLVLTVLVVAAVALVTVFAVNLGKKNNTTTAVLSPTTQEHLENTPNWKFSSTPWINCLDANKVYCSPSLTRQPGGCLKMRYYPRCGASCNAGCPAACNNCVHGSCQ